MTEREKYIAEFKDSQKKFENGRDLKAVREALDKYNAEVQKDFDKLKELLKNGPLFEI